MIVSLICFLPLNFRALPDLQEKQDQEETPDLQGHRSFVFRLMKFSCVFLIIFCLQDINTLRQLGGKKH